MLNKKLIFLIFLSLYSLSNQLLLFSDESTIYFNQTKSYELNLKDLLKNNGDSILNSPIIISVHNNEGIKIKKQTEKLLKESRKWNILMITS